jgi:hypothetical protein
MVTLVGAGDIASCSYNRDEKTAKLLDTIPGTVFTAGDNAYSSGTFSQFQNCYGPTWGRHLLRTRPSVGNHEYHTSGASGYFQYFGAAAGPSGQGYYSYNYGDWHIVVLNSMCQKIGGCSASSPQAQWLRGDLVANPITTVVNSRTVWHHALFDDQGGDDGADGGPEDGEIVE